jgi:hypothetical protein
MPLEQLNRIYIQAGHTHCFEDKYQVNGQVNIEGLENWNKNCCDMGHGETDVTVNML